MNWVLLILILILLEKNNSKHFSKPFEQFIEKKQFKIVINLQIKYCEFRFYTKIANGFRTYC